MNVPAPQAPVFYPVVAFVAEMAFLQLCVFLRYDFASMYSLRLIY